MAHSYEAIENKQLAIYSYTEALNKDPTCIEAFNRLLNSYLLKRTEKEQLMSTLNFQKEDQWLKLYYESRIKNII